jgi:hypothetical protein
MTKYQVVSSVDNFLYVNTDDLELANETANNFNELVGTTEAIVIETTED